MIANDAWVPLAEVARPHGVRGELRLKVYNTDSDVLLAQDDVLLRLPDGEEHEVSVDGARRADQAILLKLYSVDDRDRAEELRGAQICVRRDAFPPLEAGEFYACDIVGARVSCGEADVGEVRELRSYPSVEALVVSAKDGGKDWEIPLVSTYIARVDSAAGHIELATLEGLER